MQPRLLQEKIELPVRRTKTPARPKEKFIRDDDSASSIAESEGGEPLDIYLGWVKTVLLAPHHLPCLPMLPMAKCGTPDARENLSCLWPFMHAFCRLRKLLT